MMTVLIAIGFVVAVVGFFVFVAAIPEIFCVFKRARQRRTDPGRVVFERVVGLLDDHPMEWEESGGTWLFKPAEIAIFKRGSIYDMDLFVGVRGTRLKPSEGWAVRIKRAIARVEAKRALAQQLHDVCDAVEALAASNVIPFKREDAA